jgi:hypothetical protein
MPVEIEPLLGIPTSFIEAGSPFPMGETVHI